MAGPGPEFVATVDGLGAWLVPAAGAPGVRNALLPDATLPSHCSRMDAGDCIHGEKVSASCSSDGVWPMLVPVPIPPRAPPRARLGADLLGKDMAAVGCVVGAGLAVGAGHCVQVQTRMMRWVDTYPPPGIIGTSNMNCKKQGDQQCIPYTLSPNCSIKYD